MNGSYQLSAISYQLSASDRYLVNLVLKRKKHKAAGAKGIGP
jgi:hypothetical protein